MINLYQKVIVDLITSAILYISTKKLLIKIIPIIFQKDLSHHMHDGNTMFAAYVFDLASLLRKMPAEQELRLLSEVMINDTLNCQWVMPDPIWLPNR